MALHKSSCAHLVTKGEGLSRPQLWAQVRKRRSTQVHDMSTNNWHMSNAAPVVHASDHQLPCVGWRNNDHSAPKSPAVGPSVAAKENKGRIGVRIHWWTFAFRAPACAGRCADEEELILNLTKQRDLAKYEPRRQ